MSGPHYTDDAVTLHHGDCLDALREMPDASVDAVVTDPPYGLAELPARVVGAAMLAWLSGDREHVPDGRGFMGRDWDRFVPPPAVWDECLRVLKPGGHLLAFAGSRTADLMGMSIRLAGFEIRDGIDWLYASGFPKSLDVSKAIDKAAGAEREPGTPGRYASRRPREDVSTVSAYQDGVGDAGSALVTAPATDDARRWAGWGTALKPAREPIVVARKPLAGTVAATVLAHGTGALNIDGCRVNPGAAVAGGGGWAAHKVDETEGWDRPYVNGVAKTEAHTAGRWPSNVVLSHAATADGVDLCADGCVSGCPVADLDRQSGITTSTNYGPRAGAKGDGWRMKANGAEYDDSGGASRFFPVFRYEAKAPTSERPRDGQTAHPTVKPLDFMRWLVRLVTPPGGVVLDPFAGSGTTAEACVIEGFRCITVEREAAYLPLIVGRLSKPIQPSLGFDFEQVAS